MIICMKGVRREKVVFLFCTVYVRTYPAMPTKASHIRARWAEVDKDYVGFKKLEQLVFLLAGFFIYF